MADKIFSLKERRKRLTERSEDEIKHDALLEIAGNPVLKRYFQMLVNGYEKAILDASRLAFADEKKRMEVLVLHAKVENMKKLIQAAEDEKRGEDSGS